MPRLIYRMQNFQHYIETAAVSEMRHSADCCISRAPGGDAPCITPTSDTASQQDAV